MISTRSIIYDLKVIHDNGLLGKIEFLVEVEDTYKYNFIYQEEDIVSHNINIHTISINGVPVSIEEVEKLFNLSRLELEITDFISGNEEELKVGFSLPIISNDTSIIVEKITGEQEPTYELDDPLY